MTEKIIGIDLGTTNSCVAIIEAGRPVVIPNSEGARTTPSVVAFNQFGARLVGDTAKRQAIQNPDHTIQSIKRYMGANHRIIINHRHFSPEQISACILQKLKSQAQQYLGQKVSKAIVTVPAYFDDAQRLATRHAGEIAGLEIVRVINEPTACALAYGFNRVGQEANVVIFDFGGGTFDVSILQMGEGVLQVKATNGNNRLGGDDFDQCISKFLTDIVKENHGVDFSDDKMAMQRFREAAENIKIELSGLSSAQIHLPFLGFANGEPIHLESEIFRPEFERFTQHLVRATAEPIENALKDAKLNADQIDHVILVGGTTRIPAVQSFIRTFFNKEPAKSVNPDEAVAIGAAIQGGILTGEIQEMLLLDVIPLTLGIEEPDGTFQRIIERNTTIPSTRTVCVPTSHSNQTTISIHVLQGENEHASKNTSLARFDVNNVPPAPKGENKVEVTFEVDADGIFQCKTRVGDHVNDTVVLKRTTGYNQSELTELKSIESELLAHEMRMANKLAAIVVAEETISEVERFISKRNEDLGADKVSLITGSLDTLRRAMKYSDAGEIEQLRRKLGIQLKALNRMLSGA